MSAPCRLNASVTRWDFVAVVERISGCASRETAAVTQFPHSCGKPGRGRTACGGAGLADAFEPVSGCRRTLRLGRARVAPPPGEGSGAIGLEAITSGRLRSGLTWSQTELRGRISARFAGTGSGGFPADLGKGFRPGRNSGAVTSTRKTRCCPPNADFACQFAPPAPMHKKNGREWRRRNAA